MKERSSHLLDYALGARSKVAVLRVLINSKAGFSGNTVAKHAGMGLLAIQNALADLEQLGIIDVERGSVEHRYRLNFKHHIVQHGLRALFEAERAMAKTLVRELRPLLEGRVITAGLFGSFARGGQATGSDIDLLVVVETVRERERISAVLSDQLPGFTERYGLPVQPVIFERRRLMSGITGMHDLIESAERDWVHVAGGDFKQLRQTIPTPGTIRRRSA